MVRMFNTLRTTTRKIAFVASLSIIVFVSTFLALDAAHARGMDPFAVCSWADSSICFQPVGDNWPHAPAFNNENTGTITRTLHIWLDNHAQPDTIDTSVAPTFTLAAGQRYTFTLDTWLAVVLGPGEWVQTGMGPCLDWQQDTDIVGVGVIAPNWDAGFRSEPLGGIAECLAATSTPTPAMTQTPTTTPAPTRTPMPTPTGTVGHTAVDGPILSEPTLTAPRVLQPRAFLPMAVR